MAASFTRSHDAPLIRMTQRRRLDAFLAEHAAAAGAELRQGARVESLEADGAGVTARVGGVAVRADAVVGADGANGIVARSFGLGDGIVRGVALEGNVPLAALDRDLARTAVIELAVVPGGYGWVFPKGDHANLGVGGWGSEGPALRGHLARLANEHGVDPESLTEVRGHRLPMRRLGTPAGAGRVLLVGDAAGLVDPLSGDGMYEAFVSARLAADAIVAGDLDGIRSRARRRARPARGRLVGGEAGVRPAPAGGVRRSPGARRVHGRRGAPLRRRRASCGRTRRGARPAEARRATRRVGGLLLRQRLGEQRRRVDPPGEVTVGEEQRERLARAAEPGDVVAKPGEPATEHRPPLGRVEVVRERRRRAAERVEIAVRVAARGEQQLGATHGAVQLGLVERDLAAREEAEDRPLLGRLGALERPHPVADRVPRHARVLAQSRDERVAPRRARRSSLFGFRSFPAVADQACARGVRYE